MFVIGDKYNGHVHVTMWMVISVSPVQKINRSEAIAVLYLKMPSDHPASLHTVKGHLDEEIWSAGRLDTFNV